MRMQWLLRKNIANPVSKIGAFSVVFSYTRGDKGPNPFAKKVQENATNSNNPFLRNSGASKSMTRSESFFDKVNAIEEESEANKSQRNFFAKFIATLTHSIDRR